MNNTTIGDLPEDVLVEILSRLPCYKYVSECKCVSKRWCSLMSDPSFFGRFLCLQSDHKRTQIIRTLINRDGVEFLARLSSSGKPLTPLFERLVSFHHLKEEPIVVGTYNDLVLCCASNYYQRDYYICNPYTCQWVPLPPPPQLCEFAPVGFICDLPYYQYRKDDDNHDQKRQCIQLNADFRYRVVRLITDRRNISCKFKVQIFSSETGEWTESIVSTQSLVRYGDINSHMNFPYNGVLYWMSHDCTFLIGVDPFMITDRNSTSSPSTSSCSTPDDSIDHYRCRFIEFDQRDENYDLECVGVNRGCLQMLDYDSENHVLSVLELNEEEISAGAGKFCLDQRVRDYYALDWEMVPEDDDAHEYLVFLLPFDPNDDGTLYLHIRDNSRIGPIFTYNIHTGESSKIVEKISLERYCFYPLALPWWPTPVPRLPVRLLR
ncbi:putative F-box domain-containing protein [Rosa chinensis]|uniref:Putative F-box domain-containing protein n=1 Tax=Rosa chinensis TaxID=74649 RepID=A0A2P6RT39_ROSCH|nr:putative F-box domain-containing protein [Rosa chinensis]